MQSVKEKQNKVYASLKKEFGYKNKMEAPSIVKVVVSSAFGKASDRKKRGELVADRLAKITGQKPMARQAKTSIAAFKLRDGEIIGSSVSLRGNRMYAFLDKLFNGAIPRMRDFRGFDKKSIDAMGNYTMGIPEHTIFPETPDEEIRDVFGMAITITTTARTPKEAEKFLEEIGVPFKK